MDMRMGLCKAHATEQSATSNTHAYNSNHMDTCTCDIISPCEWNNVRFFVELYLVNVVVVHQHVSN